MNRRTFTKALGAALLALNLHLVPDITFWAPGKPPELLFFEHQIRKQLESWEDAGLIAPDWSFDGDFVDVTLRGVVNRIEIKGTVSV